MKPFLSACLLSACFASTISNAAPPAWWSEGTPPVIDPTAASNNKGPANIGQAKWMAKNALDALRVVSNVTANAVEADLVGVGKPIPNWNAPANPTEQAAQKAPLLIGQLKAISAPFYTHLNTLNATWLENERNLNQTAISGTYFPWTPATTDDANKAIATIGQLKAVFSLRFENGLVSSSPTLAAHWKMNERSGYYLSDSSGNQHLATAGGSPEWNGGLNGLGGVTLDGVTDHFVSHPATRPQLNFGENSFSISLWFKTSTAGTQRLISAGQGYFISIGHAGPGKLCFGVGGHESTSAMINTTATFNNGSWHHITAVCDRTADLLRIYVDGELEEIQKVTGYGGTLGESDHALDISGFTTLPASSPLPLYLGAFRINSSSSLQEFFTGDLDDVRIYNGALGVPEVQALYDLDELGNNVPDRTETPINAFVDTDNDGIPDATELLEGSDPNNPSSHSGLLKLVIHTRLE